MADLTLKQLKIVAAIARTGRVQAAADTIGVTAPAITLQLKQLEHIVGLPLFDRTRQAMVPTAAGRRLLETARRMDEALHDTEHDLATLRGLLNGSVSLGVVSTAKYFAPAALGAFRKLHPDIAMRLLVGNREEIVRSLAALESDLVVMGLPPEGVDTDAATIGDHPHVVIAPPDHKLARRARLPFAALADEPFLVREPGSGTRMLMDRLFGTAGINPPVSMEMKSNETIKQAVMAGLGIAFLSGHTIAAEVETGRIAILDVAGLPARRQWQVVRNRAKRLLPASEALWNFFVREGHSFLPPVLLHARPRRLP